VNTDMGSSEKVERSLTRFFPDSAEQIARSMEMLGLQDKLHEAFRAAIARARARQGRKQSTQLPVGTTKDDPNDGNLLR